MGGRKREREGGRGREREGEGVRGRRKKTDYVPPHTLLDHVRSCPLE